MQWDYKRVRKNAWNLTFGKGLKPWLMLVVIGFLFAFVGSQNSSQVSFIGNIDQIITGEDVTAPGNIGYLKDYVINIPFIKNNEFLSTRDFLVILDGLTRRVTWLVRIFAFNMAYIQRNPGEVIINLLLASALTIFIKFLIQNVIVVGMHRYMMESRYEMIVPARRIFSPFHREYILNIVKVMVIYNVVLILWSLTIVGGVYKYFQYKMVPFLIAENPSISWKEAKKLSKKMTEGYKWNIFVTDLSYIYIWLLYLVPVLGLIIAIPLNEMLAVEIYFTLRSNPKIKSPCLTEKVFNGPSVLEMNETERTLVGTPDYLLKDTVTDFRPLKGDDVFPYDLKDAIIFFFAFSMVGWIWEVIWNFIQTNQFANRGSFYGPWLPIYGAGGVAMIFLLDRFKENKIKVFVYAILMSAVLEYAVSFVLDFAFNASYWDYNMMTFNLNGRICLAGLIAFGIGALGGVYVAAPLIVRLEGRFKKKHLAILCALLCLAFSVDVIYCIINGFNTGENVGEKLSILCNNFL